MKSEATSYRAWIESYLSHHAQLLNNLLLDQIAEWIGHLQQAHRNNRQIFVCGNGGNAASASHFVTGLGKGASDAIGKRFRVISLNENVPWLTAIGNDYDYADVFCRQLENYAQPDDLLIVSSVSGSSPNLVRAVQWANQNGLKTLAMVGKTGGMLSSLSQDLIFVKDEHYGRVEDAQMTIFHILSYSIMEYIQPSL